MNCVQCNKETINPKFCSRSCAATHTNKTHQKRQATGSCKVCGCTIQKHKSYCKTCPRDRPSCDDPTISELESRYSKHPKSSSYNLIRWRARKIAADLGWKVCSTCGYDKHIEIAHKKPIHSYPKTTKVSEINQIINLVPLCPNCHWEFDNLVPDVGLEPT